MKIRNIFMASAILIGGIAAVTMNSNVNQSLGATQVGTFMEGCDLLQSFSQIYNFQSCIHIRITAGDKIKAIGMVEPIVNKCAFDLKVYLLVRNGVTTTDYLQNLSYSYPNEVLKYV